MAFPMLFLQPSLISSSGLQLTSISRRLCNHWWASPSSRYGDLHAFAIRWWWGASTWQSGGGSVQSAQGQQASVAQFCSTGQLSKTQMGLVSKGFFNGFLLSCLFLSSLNELDTARAAGFELGFSGGERQAEQQQQQVEPTKGNCATCLGVVDETLGACGAVPNCVSTFDDRPAFFIAPWEFPGKLPTAFQQMQRILVEEGGIIAEQGNRYIHVVFTDKDGTIDDVEFLFSIPSIDATVNIRSASRRVSSNDYGRNQNRLERIRRALMWEEVPVLRNRSRKLFFLESPWDTFGPEPPPAFDYEDRLEFVPD